jgi:predicted Zn finger-like uncharacterized protein
MIVQCPECKTKFELDPERISGATAKVRCSRCQNVFTVTRPPAEAPEAPGVAEEDEEVFAPSGRRSKRGLLLVLTLVLLVAAALAVWRYLPWPLSPEKDARNAGTELLHLMKTKGYFITNEHDGQLFVIEGQVRNEFPTPRRWIRLRAKLYTSDGRTAQELDFYAGHSLSPEQLRTLPLTELLDSIQKRSPPPEASRLIASQEAVSFTVPFGNLPELSRLTDYSVEVLGSQPA